MEVLRTLPQETRGLHIVASSENETLLFKIESNCAHPDSRRDSTSGESNPYGPDVKSVELRRVYDVATKCGGTSIFWLSNREFSAWVILPLHGQDNTGMRMYYRQSEK